jgi:hypothetical protein
MGVSVREYARRRGVSHTAVRKAVLAGRIPQEADGSIDPTKADAAWAAETNPARNSKAQDQPVPVPLPQAAIAQTSGTGPSFAQARAMHEFAKAQRARIQVDRLKEKVVERARASALVFKLARQERDSWITWPARVAAQMAAEVGIDVHLMQNLLEAHVRSHLEELSEIEPSFR